MKLEWMGRSRGVIERVIRFGNLYAGNYKVERLVGDVAMTATELQALEYLLENEELKENMVSVARRLGIPSSSFTKMVSKLTDRGLLEKYHTVDNKKDVVVVVSEYGVQIYQQYMQSSYVRWAQQVNQLLSTWTPEQIRQIEEMLDICCGAAGSKRQDLSKPAGDVLVPLSTGSQRKKGTGAKR